MTTIAALAPIAAVAEGASDCLCKVIVAVTMGDSSVEVDPERLRGLFQPELRIPTLSCLSTAAVVR